MKVLETKDPLSLEEGKTIKKESVVQKDRKRVG